MLELIYVHRYLFECREHQRLTNKLCLAAHEQLAAHLILKN